MVIVNAQIDIDVEDILLFCLDDCRIEDIFELKYFTIRDKIFSSVEKAMTALNEAVEELIKIKGSY